MAYLKGTFKVEKDTEQCEIKVTSFSSGDMAVKLSGVSNLDWRVTVEQIAIDLDYDGETFNEDFVDSPENAIDYVQGQYTFPIQDVGERIALKITDILGESVLISQDI